jgi:hypothetical protein
VILWRERGEERLFRISALEGVGIKRVAGPELLSSNAADSLPRYLRYGSRRLGFRREDAGVVV